MRKRSLCPSNGDLEEVKDIMNHDYVIKQEAWMEEGILVNIQKFEIRHDQKPTQTDRQTRRLLFFSELMEKNRFDSFHFWAISQLLQREARKRRIREEAGRRRKKKNLLFFEAFIPRRAGKSFPCFSCARALPSCY